jgi:uncharacterized protein YutE (UPF0331/DUF86 family)
MGEGAGEGVSGIWRIIWVRNRLVHEYESLEDAKVLGSIGTILELYPRYVQAVEAYLTKAGL